MKPEKNEDKTQGDNIKLGDMVFLCISMITQSTSNINDIVFPTLPSVNHLYALYLLMILSSHWCKHLFVIC